MKAFAGPLWVAGLLMLIFESNGSGGGSDTESNLMAAVTDLDVATVVDAMGGAASIGFFAAVFVFLLLGHAFIRTGFIRQCATVLGGVDNGFRALFSGVDQMGQMLLLSIIQAGIVIAFGVVVVGPALLVGAFTDGDTGLIVGVVLGLIALVPAIYVFLGILLADFAIALEGYGAVDAIKRSWQLTNGNRGSLFVFSFIVGLAQSAAALLGLLMLCVGAFVTIPLARSLVGVSYAESYLLLTNGDSAWSTSD